MDDILIIYSSHLTFLCFPKLYGSVLRDINNVTCVFQRSAIPLVRPHKFMHPDDYLILEDEGGRVKLHGDVLLPSVYVTGLRSMPILHFLVLVVQKFIACTSVSYFSAPFVICFHLCWFFGRLLDFS